MYIVSSIAIWISHKKICGWAQFSLSRRSFNFLSHTYFDKLPYSEKKIQFVASG